MIAADRPLRRMLDVARPWWGEVLLGALAGAAAIASGIGLLAAAAWLIARAAQHPNEASLAVAVVVVRACGVGRGLLRYAERLLSHDAAFRVLAELRVRVWERLVLVMPAGLGGLRSGDLLTRMVSDIDGVQDLIVRGLTPPLVAFLTGGATVVGICLVSAPSAAILGAGLLAAAVLIPLLAVRTSTASADATAGDRGELATRVTDVIDGCGELVAYGADAEALRSAAAVDDRLLRAARRSSWSAGLTSSLTSIVTGATVWLLLVVAAPANRIGAAVVVLTGLAAFEATGPLAAAAQRLAAVRASSRRVIQLLDAPDAVPAGPHPLPAAPAGGRRIELVKTSVRFHPDGPWALCDVDLVLAPGRRVALVGPSGSGKSTIASLLLRLRDPDSGLVLLDGVPLTDLDPDDVRTVVGGCTSDAYVFDATLRDNLRLARPSARQDELDDAARRVRLLDWIEGQPAGWDTPVGAHGTLLSGGERQRLVLARALLADPPVLVLDEPTAHLDPATRDEVLLDLLAATVGRTVLLITHDAAGLDAMDEVVRLADGRVAAVSTS